MNKLLTINFIDFFMKTFYILTTHTFKFPLLLHKFIYLLCFSKELFSNDLFFKTLNNRFISGMG